MICNSHLRQSEKKGKIYLHTGLKSSEAILYFQNYNILYAPEIVLDGINFFVLEYNMQPQFIVKYRGFSFLQYCQAGERYQHIQITHSINHRLLV